MTPWLVHELRNLGLEVVCLDARHARAALKMQINKTDQNDAEGLAQIVRNGWYRTVHVKSFDRHRARTLLGVGIQLIGMMTRLSNHIRGVLKTFGLLPGAMRGLPFQTAPFIDRNVLCQHYSEAAFQKIVKSFPLGTVMKYRHYTVTASALIAAFYANPGEEPVSTSEGRASVAYG